MEIYNMKKLTIIFFISLLLIDARFVFPREIKATLVGTIRNIGGVVKSVVLSPDGKYIVSSGEDGQIHFWNAQTGNFIKAIKTDGWVVQFTPDGKYLVNGGRSSNEITIWDFEKGSLLRTLKGHTDDIWAVRITKDGKTIVSGSLDGTIRIWDFETGVLIRTIETHQSDIRFLVLAPDGKHIVSMGGDERTRAIKIWDMKSGKLVRTFNENLVQVWSLTVTPDGKYVISGNIDHTIGVWEFKSGKLKNILTGHKKPVLTVQVTPDGKYIISGSIDRTIRFWDLNSGTPVRTLEGSDDSIQSIALFPDGASLVAGCNDGKIRKWDLNTNKLQWTIEAQEISIRSGDVSPDGKYIAGLCWDGWIKTWESATGKLINGWLAHGTRWCDLTYSPDGQLIASTSSDKKVKVWDASTGAQKYAFAGSDLFIQLIAFTPDGKSLIQADLITRLWDLVTGALVNLTTQVKSIRDMVFSPDGKYIILAGGDSMFVQETFSGKVVRSMVSPGEIIEETVVSPRFGRPATIKRNKSQFGAITFSHDGKYLVSGHYDNVIRVWDFNTGEIVRTIEGKSVHHRSGALEGKPVVIRKVIISSDGKYIISGEMDGAIRFWEFNSGNPAGAIDNKGIVISLNITPDGKYCIAGGAGINIWELQEQ